MLPPEKMGVYSILLTITALSLILNKNLRKIFAPLISKLYSEGNYTELNNLYKKTTFLISLFSIPLAILIIFFSDEILNYFSESGELIIYKPYLVAIMLARVILLLAGNSGTFMVMAGLEQKELELQSIKAVLIISLALIFVKKYELLAIVSLYIISMIFVNIIQLFHIYKKMNISPFSKELLYLILVTFPIIWFSIDQNYEFQFYHYVLISISVYLMYFSIMYYPLKKIIKELL
jgi:O-antigen/teichoic acid export membrane protein